MKSSTILVFASAVSVALGAAAEAQNKRNIISALRGGLPHIPFSLARLDPGWWKATTPTTTAAPTTAAPNATANPCAKTVSAGGLFEVEIEKCTPFLNMPGTFVADTEYWKNECKSVPAGATYVKMTVDQVTDYFKPRGVRSMCDMLTSGDKHEWSVDGIGWNTPGASTAGLGGSDDGWLGEKKCGSDPRDTPNFWGVKTNSTQTGGCCHANYSLAGKAWAKPFKMEYCGLPKALAPVCTPMTTVAGSFSADSAFWALQCKAIPMTASFVKIAMGDSVDFYRPPTGTSFCDMLTANNKHKWSKDGETWTTPTYDTLSVSFGGSAEKGVDTSDARNKTSFWGSNLATDTGGCCYTSNLSETPGFGKPFTMSYCEVVVPPATSQLVALLHNNEDAIQALENTLNGLHTRLSNAEQVDVDAAGNVSLAQSGMYKLAMKAKNEADELDSVTLRSSLFNSSLDNAETQLNGAQKRIAVAAKSAKEIRLIAEQTATAKGLAAQDSLNDKIWMLLDPSNKDSLDKTEARVRAMEKAADKFRGQLRGEVKTVLVTKMRRSAGKLRKVIHKLGTAGNKESDSNLGDVESSDSLGADLGLNDS
jgi:hypothetical protein